MVGEFPVEFQNVALSFGRNQVHRDLNFKIRAGEVVTILGPSGSGKTLILKLIMGLIMPTSGQVKVMGEDLTNIDDQHLHDLRLNIGMLFQGAALFDSLTIYENIAYSLRELAQLKEDQIAAVVQEKLELIGLPGIEQKYPPQLSGGQKKRVGLARALASSPKIMLFDEPTTGLDPTSVRMIDELILLLKNKSNMTSIVVTHDIESAKRISDRWMLLNKGIIAADGMVDQLLRSNKLVCDFVQGRWQEEGIRA